jgi:hypothetical protein
MQDRKEVVAGWAFRNKHHDRKQGSSMTEVYMDRLLHLRWRFRDPGIEIGPYLKA